MESVYALGSTPTLAWFLQAVQIYVVPFALKLLAVLLVFWIGTRVIKWSRKLANKALTKGKADKGVVTFLDSFIKFGLYAVLLVILLGMFGVEMTSIAAVLASAGVAIGLALQGSLSNLAGGVLILLLKPFGVGDYIVTGGYEGTVTEIQLFYTKLTTGDNKVVVMPNGSLSNGNIVNVSVNNKRRVDVVVTISYDSDMQKAKEVLGEIVRKCPYTLQEEPYQAFVDELSTQGIKMHARMWVESANYFAALSYLAEEIKNSYDQNGIALFYNKAVVVNDTK